MSFGSGGTGPNQFAKLALLERWREQNDRQHRSPPPGLMGAMGDVRELCLNAMTDIFSYLLSALVVTERDQRIDKRGFPGGPEERGR